MEIKIDINKQEITSLEISKTSIKFDDLKKEISAMTPSDFLYGNKILPSVYLFHDQKSIYIGESNDAWNRLNRHRQTKNLKPDDKLSIISSKYFNKSVVYDLETTLIDLFFADNKFKLRNKNTDQKLYNFYMAAEYRKIVKPLWDYFNEIGLVKTKYDELIHDATFIYSPYKKLNDKQLKTVKSIKEKLKDGITLIKGQPGTGKSILATRLLLDLDQEGYKVALTSATNNTYNNFKKVFKNIKSTIKHNATTFNSNVIPVVQLCKTEEKFDVIIIDEAHRLRRGDAKRGIPGAVVHIRRSDSDDELDMLIKKYKKVILMYDDNQTAHDQDIQDLSKKYLNKISNTYVLTEQMRSREGLEFVEYIVNLLDNEPSAYQLNDNYDVKVFDSFANMYEELKNKSKEYSLVRLLSGYSRPWISKSQPNAYDFDIDGIKLKWNKEANNWLHSEGAKNLEEIAYFHVIQGLDLHYAGIIIGKDLKYRNGKIIADRNEVGQANQLPTKDSKNFEKELFRMITNRYKILLSRGAKGVYIYIEDEPLREYIKNTIK